VYESYGELLSELQENIYFSQKVVRWRELVSLEKTRSTLLNDQEVIQSKIISLLISGSTIYSKDIIGLVHDASEIGQLLGVHDHKIDELRQTLSD
jgi:hypothetical protein